ncbi:MAG: hypothetical protein ABR606_10815, partial [Vicinamibacterales bacterium]
MTRHTQFCSLTAALAIAAGCSGSPETPLSPTAATNVTGLAANPDGSTLKVTAPTPLTPDAGETLNTRRPTFILRNAASVNAVTLTGVVYRLQLLNEDGSLASERLIPQTSGDTSFEADGDLDYEKNFSWRVRAEVDAAFGPWSRTAAFRTPNRPTGSTPRTGGTGAPRSIELGEAIAIIQRIYNDMRWNIGSRSSRDQRNLYLEAAVAALHYGHSRFNPAGPDGNWCIKNGGPGRPQADDVIVRCNTGEAWDLVVSIGADHYHWHPDYLGRLRPPQQIYPPS